LFIQRFIYDVNIIKTKKLANFRQGKKRPPGVITAAAPFLTDLGGDGGEDLYGY